jgi:hypothetical protein
VSIAPEMIKCPWCAQDILAEAKKCKHSAEYLTNVRLQSLQSSATVQSSEELQPAIPEPAQETVSSADQWELDDLIGG